MYLSELEIVGFKSFGQKTNFKFTDGITAVVGPNGCGKSNVVDAIRWVLGEQKTNVLRSDSMGNVIFNGSKNRKSVGMAEVTMTIENNKNVLPSDYSQVSICRRLFKNGDSKYLLNKTACRLKDITELFMDTGLGPDSYSVIELKMVESIISTKNEERRFLFEEAAGVTKYKQRRKEAERKLKTVEEDLNRVKDIVAEVEKNVNSLSRQAAKTRRYNKLIDELKEFEILYLKSIFIENSKVLNDFNLHLSKLEEKKSEAEKQLSEKLEFQKQNKEKLSTVLEKYEEERKELNSINSEIANLKQKIAVDMEKYNSIIISKDRIEKEITEAKDAATGQKNRLKKIIIELENDEKQLSVLNDTFSDKQDEFKKKESSLYNIKQKVNEANQALFDARNEYNQAKSQMAANESRVKTIQTKIDISNKEIEELKNKITNLNLEVQEQTKLIEEKKSEIKTKEETLIKNEKNKKELEVKISELRNQINEEKNKLSSKKELLSFLNSLVDNKSQIPFFKENSDWKINNLDTLGELTGTDEKYRIAVQSALGEYADYIVLENREDILHAFKLLEENTKGKENFICKNLIDEEIKFKKNKDLIYLSEIIRCEKDLSKLINNLFADTAVFDNFESAQQAIDNKLCSRAITLKGEIINRLGILRGGGLLKSEGALIGRKERIENAEIEINNYQESIENLNNTLSELQVEHNAINLFKLKEDVKTSEHQLRIIESNLSNFNLKLNSNYSKIDLISETISKSEQEQEQINTDQISIDKKAKEIRILIGKCEENFNKENAELKLVEEKVANLNEEQRKAELKLVQLKTNTRNKQFEQERIENSIRNIEKRNENRQEELFNNDNVINTIKDNQKSHKLKLAQSESKSLELQSNVEHFKKEIDVFQTQNNDVEQELITNRIAIDQIKDSIHRKDLEQSQVKNKVESIVNQAQEKYGIELIFDKISLPEKFDHLENETLVREIKDKLSNIGNVNFLALDEFETQNERLTFYNRQVGDLEDSQNILSETITEINETAQRKFVDTFEKIRKNFKELFDVLFADETGSADIVLGEGNPLEATIEIKAKPPGKKTPSLSMLSTGEKTLVAISLLFAIYLVKPSPLCILDEVDAPLDDANIDRFINLIKKFSNDTQFLVVTHNKKTMKAADNLYGVTMQEQGLSKVVSVQFDNIKQ